MRSYALLIFALAVLGARAATIPAPTEAEKLPNESEALDNVSLDNNVSEQELSDRPNIIKEAENEIPMANVPVEIIEEQSVLKTIALKEDSNDYVPDNDDSTNIKRVEIDLNNPGPPQRQEHDSQNPINYIDKERAVAVVQKSIAESQNTFNHALQDITQVFQKFAANKENLEGVQTNIKTLKQNVNLQVTKLSDTIDSYLNPEGVKVIEDVSHIEEVKNSLRSLQDKINTGMDVLYEGADVLSILKEEDEKDLPDKISGKADNVNVASTATGTSPTPTPPISSTLPPPNLFESFMTSFQNTVGTAFTNMGNMVQNFINPNQNQNQQPPQQGAAPAGTQSDQPAASTQRPNLFQYLQTVFNPGANNQQQTDQNQNQNPPFSISQLNPANYFGQIMSNIFQQQPQQINQQTSQTSNVNQPASDTPVQAVPVTPAPAQASNSVPAAPAPQPQPASAPQTVQNPPAQVGPIQQIVQNNPIVKGITNAVQRIQGLSNPSTPRDTPKSPNGENSDGKGHGSGTANGSNNISGSIGVDTSVISAPTKAEPETISEVKNEEQEPVAELNKTE
ncbi:uncharacterized protein [Epargyreus clarus]|uniref:uncharacterized protein n=1 Tax=Epargyreus clarus TaxID=520877 RepID=UPI003C2E5AA3